MIESISDMPENKEFSDYSEGTEFVLEEKYPRYILNPFEIVMPSDPRYKTALTREQINEMT